MTERKLIGNEIKETNEIDIKIIDEQIELLNKLKNKLLSFEKVDIAYCTDYNDNFENDIQDILLNTLRCRPNLRGYVYLLEAFKIIHKNPDVIYSITKNLYPKVAEICTEKLNNSCINAHSVERGIRHSIQTSIVNVSKKDYELIFGNDQKLNNSAYIAYVMEYYEKSNRKKLYKKI